MKLFSKKNLIVFSLFILTILVGLIFSYCKKYPEGGKISNCKSNLRGTWKVKNVIINQVDILPSYNDSLKTSSIEDLHVKIIPDFEPCKTCPKTSSSYDKYNFFGIANEKLDSFSMSLQIAFDLLEKDKKISFKEKSTLNGREKKLWFIDNNNFIITRLTDKELKIKNDTHEIIFEKKSNSI